MQVVALFSTLNVPCSQGVHTVLLLGVPGAVLLVPGAQTAYAVHAAVLFAAVNVPSAQAAQVWFCEVEPATEMN